MKTKINYLFIFLGCMLIFPYIAKAECSYEREAELSRIASNVQFNYTYEPGIGVGAFFDVNITNITNDIYIEDGTGNQITGTGEKIISYLQGSTITYNIYSNDNSCRGEKILTRYVNLPSANPYFESDECKKYPNFKYCQIWLSENIDTTKFAEELEKYKEQSQSSITENTENSLANFFSNKIVIATMFIISIMIIALVVRKIVRRS